MDKTLDFDAKYYLEKYPEVAAAGLDPYEHYLEHGIPEGRHPNAADEPHFTSAEARHLRAPARSPLRVVTGETVRRLTLLVDEIAVDSEHPDVIAAVALAAQWARRTGRELRVVTRRTPADAATLAAVFAETRISLLATSELVHVPWDGGDPLSVGDDDLFLATTWQNTEAVLGSIPARQVAYLISEDERALTALGADTLAATAVMNHPGLAVAVATTSLYEHLIRAGAENLAQTGQAFEPSAATFATDGRVCAVPDTSRNLVIETSPLSYRLTDLALAAVDLAIERGYLAAGRWQIHLTGRDAPGIRLLDDTSPARLGILDWPAYRNLLATADLGLSLTASARPDYATNALAASGAFVVTNTWPGKPDLTTELNRVIMAVPNASALADAIGAAVARIEAEGQEPYTPQGTCLSPWPVVLYDVVEHLAKARGDV